jgi:hypothetical protein
MEKFTIQSTGKDTLERAYTDGKPAQYMLANTRHYSWPKGAGKFSIPVPKNSPFLFADLITSSDFRGWLG